MIMKYNDVKLFGHKVDATWFRDIRKARKKGGVLLEDAYLEDHPWECEDLDSHRRVDITDHPLRGNEFRQAILVLLIHTALTPKVVTVGACSPPPEGSPNKTERLPTMGLQSSRSPVESGTPIHRDFTRQPVEKASTVESTQPVSGTVSPAVSPKKKRSKKLKKHGRGHRHGKRKRRDKELVAYLSGSESPEVEQERSSLRHGYDQQQSQSQQQQQQQQQQEQQLTESEKERIPITGGWKSPEPRNQIVSERLTFNLNESDIPTNNHFEETEITMIELEEGEEVDDEQPVDNASKESKNEDEQRGETTITQEEDENRTMETDTGQISLEDICLPQEPVAESTDLLEPDRMESRNVVPKAPLQTAADRIPEGPALPDNFILNEPEEPVYIGEGPDLPPDHYAQSSGGPSDESDRPCKPDDQIGFKSTLC
ncbi:unnamed protein product, partial [Echinostoma caproni]|uniref:BRCT domain-containing protein n=1 Tax=Echinostoma caproni TaxID=27848 RepID=A0A183B5H7_9TREM